MLHTMFENVLRIGTARCSVLASRSTGPMLNSTGINNSASNYHTTATANAVKKIPFEYVKAKRIPSIFKSGDKEVSSIDKLDKNEYQVKFRGAKELEDADEVVKKMCSLHFATKSEASRVFKRELVDRVRRSDCDNTSIEVQIAEQTGKIRALQAHVRKRRRDVKRRVMLKLEIEKRKKYLGYLRRRDYERFEWLLEQLNIEYQQPARFYWYETRRGALREMVQKYCDDTRVAKLQAFRDTLKAQQEAFLKEKEEKLRFIAQEEVELGLRSASDMDDATAAAETDYVRPKPAPIESTMLRVAHTAEGPVVYSVPTWPPKVED